MESSPGLSGTVAIPGSKNSSLSLLAAACLAEEPVTLKGVPQLGDYRVIEEIGREIGLVMTMGAPGVVTLDPRGIHGAEIDPVKSAAFRTSYYFVGALLAKHGKVTVGYPGGDDFVQRPIDQHVKALQAMGASFTFHKGYYEVEAKRLTGADIYFDTITSGATMNALMAASLAKGTTVLRNAAKDPEVVDTAMLLNRMGARITGAGTDIIRIEGVDSLGGCAHTVIPDRLIAGAFLAAAGVTGGRITVQGVIPEHLGSCISKLEEIGLQIDTGTDSITAASTGRLKAVRIRTGMYPAFATDLQQPFTALLLQAAGRSIVADRIYPNRFSHIDQLRRMGAQIKTRTGVAVIQGGVPLRGGYVHATDIRAGICLLLAGLAAEGVTRIAGVHHIERGYENAVEAFRSVGANIRIAEGEARESAYAQGN